MFGKWDVNSISGPAVFIQHSKSIDFRACVLCSQVPDPVNSVPKAAAGLKVPRMCDLI